MRIRLAILATILLTGPVARADSPKLLPKAVDHYGDPLPEGAVARLGTLRLRHPRTVDIVALSPDGKVVAAASLSSVYITLWDTASGKELRRLNARGIPVDTVEFSPDGRYLATASQGGDDDLVIVWEAASGKEVHRFVQTAAFIRFSADGKKLVIAENDGAIDWAIHERDLKTGKSDKTWKAPAPPKAVLETLVARSRLTFLLAPDGKTVVWRFFQKRQGTDFCEVNLFMEADTGKVRFTHEGTPNQEMRRLIFSPDGKHFAAGSSTIRVHDTATGKKVRDLDAASANPIRFTPDGKKLAWGNQGVFLEDLSSGQLVRVALSVRWNPLGDLAAPLDISADGKLLVLAAHERIMVWNVATGREVHEFPGHGEEVYSVSFSADGRHVHTLGGDPFNKLTWCAWRTDGQPVGRRTVLSDFLVARGQSAVTAQKNGDLVLRDRVTGRKIRDLIKGPEWQDASVTADGRWLAATDARQIVLVEVATGKELRRQPLPERGSNVVFAPDGKTFAWWALDGSFHVVDTLSGKEVRRFGPGATTKNVDANRIFFSRDGALLVQQRYLDGTIHVWHAATGRRIQRFTIPVNDDPSFLVVALSPDARTLAAGYQGRSRIGQVRLFEVLSGQARRQLDGHVDDINALAFSPDGALLASASSDHTALLWDMNRPRKPGSLAKRLSAADLTRLWQDLAGSAEGADDAHWALVHVPEASVPFLQKALQPAAAAGRERIQKLVRDLANDQFSIRQNATQELEQLGELTRDLLSKAQEKKPALEVRQRIARLLDKLIDLPPERLREARAVAVLERIGTPQARAVLERLAKGAAEARLTQEARTALKRLSR